MDRRGTIYRTIIVAHTIWLLVSVSPTAHAQYGRDTIRIVGSSTVYPFARVVAEKFAHTTPFKLPAIESTGSGGGFRLFCAGMGVEHPDIANASRRIKAEEFNRCLKNGVNSIVEIKIGYDGIVVANSNRSLPFHLMRKDIFLALAKSVPDPAGNRAAIDNPYQTWRSLNPRLPDIPIRVLGPSSTSGTRDSFLRLAMEAGAAQMVWSGPFQEGHHHRYPPLALREDGAYIEEGENDALIAHKLEKYPDVLGIFGFGFLVQNKRRLQGASIDDVAPTAADIASGRYPLSRPLYVYVKRAHVDHIPGIRSYLDLITSEGMWGPGGDLAAKGLVPMTETERIHYRKVARQLPVFLMNAKNNDPPH